MWLKVIKDLAFRNTSLTPGIITSIIASCRKASEQIQAKAEVKGTSSHKALNYHVFIPAQHCDFAGCPNTLTVNTVKLIEVTPGTDVFC